MQEPADAGKTFQSICTENLSALATVEETPPEKNRMEAKNIDL